MEEILTPKPKAKLKPKPTTIIKTKPTYPGSLAKADLRSEEVQPYAALTMATPTTHNDDVITGTSDVTTPKLNQKNKWDKAKEKGYDIKMANEVSRDRSVGAPLMGAKTTGPTRNWQTAYIAGGVFIGCGLLLVVVGIFGYRRRSRKGGRSCRHDDQMSSTEDHNPITKDDW